MVLTSPRIPSILRHITVATSACHPVREPPAITLQSSLGNSLVSRINQWIDQDPFSLSFTAETLSERGTYLCVSEYYRGHQESAGQSYGASGPAVGVCVSGSVRDQCVLLSVWLVRASGSESRQGNAWETHSQNLDKDIHKNKRGHYT